MEAFRIVSFDFDPARNTARFNYAFDDTHSFQEVVELGGPPLGSRAGSGIESALRLVHLAAGVSYYKAAAPARIIVETGPLSRGKQGSCTTCTTRACASSRQANSLDVPLRFEVEAGPEPGPVAGTAVPGEGPLSATVEGHRHDAPGEGIAVPIGGGKDSIVLVEALKVASPPPELAVWLVAVNPQPAMRRTAGVAGLPLASVKRTISPRLLELNLGGALNGHVPITAIVSLIVVAAGYVYGYDTTLMALERSADEATSFVGDVAVNHQWSKSTECELGLRSVIRESVSRASSTPRLCARAARSRSQGGSRTCPPTTRGFRSCNRAYRSGTVSDIWCGQCPKCRFVFLMLAPFLEPGRLAAIFGENLLDDLQQAEGFRDLFAAGRKPYECVGEQRESLLAFLLLLEHPDWRDASVVAALRPELEHSRRAVVADLDGDVPAIESADGDPRASCEVRRATAHTRSNTGVMSPMAPPPRSRDGFGAAMGRPRRVQTSRRVVSVARRRSGSLGPGIPS